MENVNSIYIFSPFSRFSSLIPPFTFVIVLIILLIILLIFVLIRMKMNINSYFSNMMKMFSFGFKKNTNTNINANTKVQKKEKELREKKLRDRQQKEYYKNITYYVCSYGGSGSYMLCDYLGNFGKVEHIHSRRPPDRLTYIGRKNTKTPVYEEWFNDSEIPETDMKQYKVIYLYKDPVKAILSRFNNPEHLHNIQIDTRIQYSDLLKHKKDLYQLEEFFDNYTKKEKKNYPIYCVKYEDFWNNIQLFNEKLELPDIKEIYPVKKETNRKEDALSEDLYKIYEPLIQKMKDMPFIKVY